MVQCNAVMYASVKLNAVLSGEYNEIQYCVDQFSDDQLYLIQWSFIIV